MTDINLKSIIKESAQIEEAFPDYPEFVLTLAYPGRKKMAELRKNATIQKIDRKTRQVVDDLDEDKFVTGFVASVIKGWRGLTVSTLQELALVDTGDLDPEDLVDFNVDNAVILMKYSPLFDDWVTEVATDLENFTKNQ